MKVLPFLVALLAMSFTVESAQAQEAPIICRHGASQAIVGGMDLDAIKCSIAVMRSDRDRLVSQLSDQLIDAKVTATMVTNDMKTAVARFAAQLKWYQDDIKGLEIKLAAAKHK